VLQLPDHWVWDFWHVHDGELHHLYFLKALRSLGDPDLRHFHQTIGHAVSTDLVTWKVRPDALAPSTGDRWDNSTNWTGSVLRHDGMWWMFYTGTSRAENSLVQRIGAATSHDLYTWERVGSQPLVEADPRWYELLDRSLWHDQAWRDPHVVKLDDTFHMFITARTNSGEPFSRGVIGHATSDDLLHWTVGPPVSEPGDFGQLEVPQFIEHEGTCTMLFCTSPEVTAPGFERRRGIAPTTGTFTLTSSKPLGPYSFVAAPAIAADAGRNGLYAGKVIYDAAQPYFLGFINNDEHGHFVGAISDPIPIRFEGSRILRL
jgi:beta-fructofuranosidase